MAKSAADVACEALDAEIAKHQDSIAGLERSKEIIRASGSAGSAPTGKKRWRKRKAGLPTEQSNGE